ncbi:EAL domain-containing protein [Vibrio metschnikovii]
MINQFFNYDDKLIIFSNIIETYFQPKVDILTNKIVGFEALTRVVSPLSLELSLDEVLLFIKKNELEKDFFNFVLSNAIDFLVRQSYLVEKIKPVSINASKFLLADPEVIDLLINTFSHSNLSSNYLVIELTEEPCSDYSPELLKNNLQLLRVNGFGVSMDDFGSQESNFDKLISHAFSEIKLDRQFLINLDDDKNQMFIDFMVRFTNSLDIRSCCRGVETPYQATILKSWVSLSCKVFCIVCR